MIPFDFPPAARLQFHKMLYKSFLALTSLQILTLTALNATPVDALPTGEPLFKRGSSPPSGAYSPQWQQCELPRNFRQLILLNGRL